MTITVDNVERAVSRWTSAENPSSFLAVNSGNEYYGTSDGIIAFRTTGRHAIIFGGPFAPEERHEELLTGFVAEQEAAGRSVTAVQVQRNETDLFAACGFVVNQVGASYAVDLTDFSLRGSAFVKLRNKLARSVRAGVTVREAEHEDVIDDLRAIDEVWLRSKGEHAQSLEFLVGELGGPMQEHRRLFVAELEGAVIGYISYSPVHGANAGWMHDLSRRLPDRIPGVMEAINTTAIDTFRAEGVTWLHFGFTPFTTLRDDWEDPSASPAFQALVHGLWEHGEAVYPARTQLAYKEKWGPSLVTPEYVAFRGQASIAGFAHVFRAAGAF